MDFDPQEIAYTPTTGVCRVQETPLIAASDESLKGYGCLVDTSDHLPDRDRAVAGARLAAGRR